MECKSVLVIEDDNDIREAVTDALRDEGYDVYAASNGSEAMAMLPKIPLPPLILLDMMMPVMNGWEFLEAQKANAQMANIPVVVVSAAPETKVLLPDSGPIEAEGMLKKPIDLENLLKVVRRYCVPAEIAQAQSS